MHVKPLRTDLAKYLTRRNLETKFAKQLSLFLINPHHPSLNMEILEPRHLKIYSFRIDKKYRVVFIFTKPNEIEIIDINLHYR